MEKRLMVIGEKESFLIRTLRKKLSESSIDSFYCPVNIDMIGRKWGEKCITAYYLNDDEHVPNDVLHFLKEHLTESGEQIIFIADKSDISQLKKLMNSTLIREFYPRPLETDRFIKDVAKVMKAGPAAVAKKKVMIVDDDTEYLALVRDWLKDRYQVFMANSGMQAIKQLGTNKVDLILLDFQMPITSGPKVLEMIRSDTETSSIPVFFLTGRNDKDSVMQVVNLKPEGYLLKTIEKQALLAKLEQFFAR